ncbi:MAG TPA: hypothetical protein PKM94_05340 [candidate division Zixibacteria bacterium]|nr:hypothetical protein [candidate division Zixibacteria bacterium]
MRSCKLAGAALLLAVLAWPLAAQDAPPVDGGWPRTFTTASDGEMTLFAPQVAAWENQERLVAFCAVSYLPAGATERRLGTIKIHAATEVSLEERLVRMTNLQIVESNFPGLPKDQVRGLLAELMASYADTARVIALDRLLAAIDKSQLGPGNLDGVKAEPPPLYVSTRPAVLVIFDGAPVWSPIKDNDLKFAVNTNWDCFAHAPTQTFYLRWEDSWLQAPDAGGPWSPAGTLPGSFDKLPDDGNWNEVAAHLPGRALPAAEAPAVFVSTVPAELLLLEGEPEYEAVAGTRLFWVRNTESDVFRLGTDGTVYLLLSGRWFSAPDFTGPWTFATPDLPEDFRNIPREHERSDVLACVPGTDEAAEAVLLAGIPQTARVNKAELKPPEVVYAGDPEFTPIEGTSCRQATNTDKDILRVGDLYYMCFQGVWFMSRTPTGPWEVTGDVPAAVYEIPPSSECHHVTYVVVEHYDPADVYVTFSYTSGYTGVIIAWGVPVYGTGWYYPPFVYWGYPYPVYYPRWVTYGYAVRYNPWTGIYAASARIYGPYGGARYGVAYNPRTGTCVRGAMAYGPYGAAGAAAAWNPRTGAYAATRQGANAYGSWGESYVQRGDNWAHTARYTDAAAGQTKRVTRTDEATVVNTRGPQGGGFIGAKGDDVYAGHDGSVYKRDENGNWSKYSDGGWTDTEKPARAGERAKGEADRPSRDAVAPQAGKASSGTPSAASTLGQLERDSAARSQGARRADQYGRQRKQAATSSREAARPRSGSGGRRR